jgi:hypothetical protein
MTALATCFNIRQRGQHAGVSGSFVHALVIASMADIAEIAKGMRLVPTCAIVINRRLRLGLVTVLAGRSLGATLGAGFGGRPEQEQPGQEQDTKARQDEELGFAKSHAALQNKDQSIRLQAP